ncbi:MAG: hypothetical protein K8I27_01205 [Planctomycetes bacterium]|nr:hypothetical protein [Planctomycetota bacterium]
MKAAKLSLLALLLITAITAPACGGKKAVNRIDGDDDRVELLGTRKVNFGADHDTILVTLLEGTFKALRVEVDGSAMEIWDIDVFFSNGGHQDINTRLHFEEGSWSRRIDLTGGARGIKKVTFKYKSKKLRSGRATIKLYGIH